MLELRPLHTNDADAVHPLLSDWEVVRYMLLPLCDRAGSEQFVQDALTESETAPWRSIVRAIVEMASGDLIGLCGIAILRGAEEGEMWYLLRPASWGRGLATQAAGRLLALGFGELNLHRIWASCVPENPASARVLEKNGMRREGCHRQNLKIHGEWKDCFLYAILAEEWRAIAHAPVRCPAST
jgi:RimJ/RimL family protein N-acetyltransferase